MPRPSIDEIRQKLAATRNPNALLTMTAQQLATLAGPNQSAAVRKTLETCKDYPRTVLHVSVSALRPELLDAAEPAPTPAPVDGLEPLTGQ